MKRLLLIFCFFLLTFATHSKELPFQANEELKYDIHYKYGLVMLKAGTANFRVTASRYNNINSYYTVLDFKTTSFFDRIYKMRDTLSSHITANLEPLYHVRSVHEGNFHFREEVIFNSFGKNYSQVRVKRTSWEAIRFDTVLFTNNFGYDIVNILQYIRSFDYSQMKAPTDNISTFFGKENVKITIRNEGQSVIERGETLKYKTYRIALDFTDSVFNESKSAIEIWISDDENRIPIKIRAKLKIGMAEVSLVSWKNLKYPLSSEVRIPVRNN